MDFLSESFSLSRVTCRAFKKRSKHLVFLFDCPFFQLWFPCDLVFVFLPPSNKMHFAGKVREGSIKLCSAEEHLWADQLRSLEWAKEISGVLGYRAAPLLQGKYREGSITPRLIVLNISQKTQHIGRMNLVRTPTVCKLVAESPLVFSSSLQHSRWRRTGRGYRALHFTAYFQNAEDGVCTQDSTCPLIKFLKPALPDLLYYYFRHTQVLPPY